MATEEPHLAITLLFAIPDEQIVSIARSNIDSPDENYRSVAKAMLDLTAEAMLTKKAIAEGVDAKLDHYLDFWFGDAVDCANKLLSYQDRDARVLGQCLIDMEKSMIKSKESLLAEMKRLALRPRG